MATALRITDTHDAGDDDRHEDDAAIEESAPQAIVHVLPVGYRPDDLGGRLAAITAEVDGEFAGNWERSPDSDPSPVGFHDSSHFIQLSVDGGAGPCMTTVELRRSLNPSHDGQPFISVNILGRGFDNRGVGSVRDDRITFAITHRSTLRSIADAMRYLADKSAATGMLAGLPADDLDEQRRRHTDERVSHALAEVRSILAGEGLDGDGHDLVYSVGHQCEACDRRRATEFSCSDCGYVGSPAVFGCDCLENYNRELDHLTGCINQMIDDGSGRVVTNYGVTYSLAQVETLLCQLIQRAPTGDCRAGDADNGERFVDCLHGNIDCPFCGRGTGVEEQMRVVRRLRRALSTIDPLMKVAAESIDDSDEDGEAGTDVEVDDDEDVVQHDDMVSVLAESRAAIGRILADGETRRAAEQSAAAAEPSEVCP